MSETFTKMFSSITESTVWCEPSPIRIVWITLLAMSDREGNVWASVPGLAARAQVSIDDVNAALEKFQQPDKYSRTVEYEGRRIEPIDGGWHLLNHQKYRDMGNPVRASLNNNGYVYYAGIPDGDRIKIGFSKNPWARLAALRTTEPQLEILATEATTMRTEGERHKQFKRDRLNGEWFAASPSLLSLVSDLSNRDSRKKAATRVATVVAEAEAEAYAESVNREAWDLYVEHRKELKAKRLTPRGAKMAQKKLASLTPDEQMTVVETSVANGWIGLFPEKVKHGTHKQDNSFDAKLAKLRERAGLDSTA